MIINQLFNCNTFGVQCGMPGNLLVRFGRGLIVNKTARINR
ncbi:MAG: hypothetical protein Q8807_03210 ['Waltheria sp.' little leaf phytoplasma]|nr:hypothetical protein ['Waltheria sp.' little leaf phytoplasma]